MTKYSLRDRSSLKRKYTEVDEYDDGDAPIQLPADADNVDTAIPDADTDYKLGDKNINTSSVKKTGKKSTKRRKVKSEPPFRFLELPAELRVAIYEYALLASDGVSIGLRQRAKGPVVKITRSVNTDDDATHFYPRPSKHGPRSAHSICTGLLQVNRQINSEAASILYGQEMSFDAMSALAEFLMLISVEMRALLKNIKVTAWTAQRTSVNRATFFLLREATSLQTFFIKADMGGVGYRGVAGRVHQVYSTARVFIEAYGRAHGSKTAALSVIKISDYNFRDQNLNSRHWWRRASGGEAGQNIEGNKANYDKLLAELVEPSLKKSKARVKTAASST